MCGQEQFRQKSIRSGPTDLDSDDLSCSNPSLLFHSCHFSVTKAGGNVQMSPDVSLPQFDVLGHRQRIVEASLSSGNYSRWIINQLIDHDMMMVLTMTLNNSCYSGWIIQLIDSKIVIMIEVLTLEQWLKAKWSSQKLLYSNKQTSKQTNKQTHSQWLKDWLHVKIYLETHRQWLGLGLEGRYKCCVIPSLLFTCTIITKQFPL